MKLTEEQKKKIIDEFNDWKDKQYGRLTEDDRRSLGAYYTPPELTIEMIEKFTSVENKKILDPCCGSGNLLAACIMSGADPNLIYGNEYNEDMVELCRNRLVPMGVPWWHIHQGDATKKEAYEFSEDYVYREEQQLSLW